MSLKLPQKGLCPSLDRPVRYHLSIVLGPHHPPHPSHTNKKIGAILDLNKQQEYHHFSSIIYVRFSLKCGE